MTSLRVCGTSPPFRRFLPKENAHDTAARTENRRQKTFEGK
ncbi:hypothetical protein SY94_3114 [Agrobacterium tumefaciens]|nr:hypothetical protein SY94_3114 [Agrobacterium tumefaciens]